jgi:uncharacterized protein YyaL (SSP411 family)
MKRKPVVIYTYTALDILLASPTEPTPIDKRTHQLSRMWQGLAALETAPEPSTDDWRVCSDAVNLLETLVDMRVCEDSSGLLMDAVTAMAQTGQRHMRGQTLRLSGQGMQAVRSVLEDYAEVLAQIPHRTALEAHRRTERRIHEISSGRRKPHDVEVMKL